LRQPAAGWPGPEDRTERVPDAPNEEEVPSEFVLVVGNDFVIQFQKFSSFNRLLPGSYGLRPYAKNREAISRNNGLTAAECKDAENRHSWSRFPTK